MNSRIRLYHVFISLLSPALAMYVAGTSKNKNYILFAGTLFMGFIGSVFIYTEGNDGQSHLMQAYRYYLDMSFREFLSGVGSLLIFQPIESSSDLYKHVLSFLAAGVFRNPELIHLFGGLLLGYFFTTSVLLVLETKPNHKLGILLASFIILFLLCRSISALNSLRMWTAMWVFFYGAFAFVKKGQMKYLWIVGLSIFIHFSYLLYAIPLVLAIVLKKRRLLIVGIFTASFFINVGFEQTSNLVESTGLYQDKAKRNVVDEELLEKLKDESVPASTQNFYKAIGPVVYKDFSTILLAITLIYIYLFKSKTVFIDFLIAVGLLIIALSNLSAESSPAVEGRGYTIAGTFLVAAAIQILCLKESFLNNGIESKIINTSFSIFIISAIPYLLFQLSYTLNTVSFFIFFMPLMSWFLGDADFSIRDFLIFNF